jgi:uncharacterized membrane protein YeiH
LIGAVLTLPLWIELPAVIAGALAGALFAQKRGLDMIGIVALALVSGLGVGSSATSCSRGSRCGSHPSRGT